MKRIRRLLLLLGVLVATLATTLQAAPAQAFYADTTTTWGTPGNLSPLGNMTVRGNGRFAFTVPGITIYRNGRVPIDTQQQADAVTMLQKWNGSSWVTVDFYDHGNMLLNMVSSPYAAGGFVGTVNLSGNGPGYYRQVYRVWWGWGQALPYWTLNSPGGLSGYKQILPNANMVCTVKCVVANGNVYVY